VSTHFKHLCSMCCLLLAITGTARADAISINDLAWMTGYWVGPVGELVMEENWNAPLAGTIAATVRMAGKNGTQMVELVIIREHEGTLALSLQQFNPDFSPQTPAPQLMQFKSLGDRTITFVSETATLKQLTYSRSTDDHYTVEAILPDGNVFKAVLSPR
jgi:Domain of unknown function (DUF6265)